MKPLERQGFEALVSCHNIVKAMEKRLGRGAVYRVQILQRIAEAPNDHIAQHARRIFPPTAAMGAVYDMYIGLCKRGFIVPHKPANSLDGYTYYRLTQKGEDYLSKAISSMTAVLSMADYRALCGYRNPKKKEADPNARNACSN